MRLVICIFCFCAFLLAYVMACLSLEQKESAVEFISSKLDFSVEDGSCTFHINEYGQSINGDGVCFYKVEFPPDVDKSEIIAGKEGWQHLPLPEPLAKLAGSGAYLPFLESRQVAIPAVQNGYYYYYNRSRLAGDRYVVPASVLDGFQNFTFALYDSDNHILYFYALDT